jgi:predicted GNAT family acetyltransferase
MTHSDGVDAAEDAAHTITTVHVPEQSRYELRDGDRTIGETVYVTWHTGQVVFTHTEVDPAYAGQGLAAQLARFALDDVRSRGRRFIAACPYISAYVRKHHEYDDILDPLPTPSSDRRAAGTR